jgi:hypothetical protein
MRFDAGVDGGHHPDVRACFVNQSDFPHADVLVDPRTGWLALWRGFHWTAYVAFSIGC